MVVAYGLILPKPILDAFPLGCFNLHASLLPRWRGAAPIQRAIMAGDRETGVMVMKMEEGLDTGPVAMAERVADRARMRPRAICTTSWRGSAPTSCCARSPRWRKARCNSRRKRDSGVTYASKIDKHETRIDWTKPWQQVHDHCRGLSPFPGAWFEIPGSGGAGRVKVLRTTKGDGTASPGEVLDERLTIACGEGAVRLIELQRAGRQPMPAAEFLRGTPIGRECVLA